LKNKPKALKYKKCYKFTFSKVFKKLFDNALYEQFNQGIRYNRPGALAMVRNRFNAFTIAELLIALVILAVIATFTIPKVLSSQQNSSWNASTKEIMAAVTNARSILQANGLLNANTRMADITPYLNYVSVDTTSVIDQQYNAATVSLDCSTASCLKFANGGVMRYSANAYFAGTDTTNALWFEFDPDGRVTDGTTNGAGKAINFRIYYNGKVRTRGTIDMQTCNSAVCLDPDTTYDAPWFSW
jgi:prepilin-type N-terminal cleavage/methylation domain-containing protein